MSKRTRLDAECTISYFQKSVATLQRKHLNQMPLVFMYMLFLMLVFMPLNLGCVNSNLTAHNPAILQLKHLLIFTQTSSV